MQVDLFIPCFIDQLYPGTAFNTIKVLCIVVVYHLCGLPK